VATTSLGWSRTRIGLPCGIYGEKLFRLLVEVVEGYGCDCIALSGGVDTSTILLAATAAGQRPRGYVAVYRGGLPRDIVYAEHVARALGIELVHVFLGSGDVEELRGAVVGCIGADRIASHGDSGCIEVRNDMVFYSVLRKAREDGCRCVYVGSGGDEVFAGYGFMLILTSGELEKTIERMSRGRFPELEIARCLGVEAVAPLLDERVLGLALEIPVDCLRASLYRGKEVLREILRERGLYSIADRAKTPAESGAGTKSVCLSVYDEE